MGSEVLDVEEAFPEERAEEVEGLQHQLHAELDRDHHQSEESACQHGYMMKTGEKTRKKRALITSCKIM